MIAVNADLAATNARLRLVAFIEATTLLVMLAAMAGRKLFDGPDISAVIGPIHGLAFLAYVVMVLFARHDNRWGPWRTLGLLLASVVPFGGFVAGHEIAEPPPS